MVDSRANIDLFFRNGLKDFEVLPPAEIWDTIKPVVRKSRRERIILRAAASVALLISIGTTAYLLTGNLTGVFNGPAITLNQDATPEGRYVPKTSQVTALSEGKPISPIAFHEPEESENSGTPATSLRLPYSLPEIDLFTPFIHEKSIQAGKVNNFRIDSEPANLLPNALPGNINILTEEAPLTKMESDPAERWSIGAMLTPTYYSGFRLGKNDAGEELLHSENGIVSYSGGFSFSYDVSTRLTIQTGLYYSAIGHRINGVGSFSGFNSYFNAKGGSEFSILTSSGTIVSDNIDIYLMDQKMSGRVLTSYTLDVFDPAKADLKYLTSSLIQNFNYLEVPFVVKYKFLDRKVDFNLIGAVSYNVLVSNSAYAYANDTRYYLGKTEGLSPVTFSSSIGMGMEYNLSARLSLNLEPTFRYYITPLGGTVGSSIHPYSFGILSGFSYKF